MIAMDPHSYEELARIANTSKVVPEAKSKELVEIIIQYAKEEGMTFRNIMSCVHIVETHMQNNAVLK